MNARSSLLPRRPARTAGGPNSASEAGAAAPGGSASAVTHLLMAESNARRAETMSDLHQVIVNEARSLLRARQTILLDGASGTWRLLAISNVASCDRTGPLARWIEGVATRLSRDVSAHEIKEFELPAYAEPDVALTREYPFRHCLWLPLWSPRSVDKVVLLLTRERAWLEADRKIGSRLAESFGHAMVLRSLMQRPLSAISRPGRVWLAAAAVAAVAGIWPVSSSVLAPVEVVPRDADVIAMPVDGIIDKVLVHPSESVQKGQPLVRLVDTSARNRLEVAAREVAVAEARVERASSLAFTDSRGRQELGIARAELKLKLAEHAYARDLHEQSVIRAPSAGITLFSDPKDLQGRPATTGQRLLLIARPGSTEFRINVPVADSVALRKGLAVRAFLDSDPLQPVDGEVTFVDHQARVSDGAMATYQMIARTRNETTHLTLGTHGTAQIRGEAMPLLIFLLRRPINAARQWLGL